jgi:hypothetical protein
MSKRKITIKSAKAKGRNLQKWVAEKISKLIGIPVGKDELISSREMGQSGTDILLIGKALELFPFSIECKSTESWQIHEAIKQAKTNQKKDTDWLLVMKRSREDPVIIMDAERFFKLMGQWKKLI